ncbi:MAG TPA: hypothetical protein VNA21_10470 [Steroidobacteraceae bacterium]|nr:hypothetical protein [Steroidobacteraceae bacterium]
MLSIATGIGPRKSSGFNEESSGDLAAFSYQYVVSPARSLRVHHLEANVCLRQRTCQARMWKALPGAGTEQNDLAAEISQSLEARRIERFEARYWPRLDVIRRDDQIGCVAHPVNFNEARTVSSNGILRGGRVGVQLQIA